MKQIIPETKPFSSDISHRIGAALFAALTMVSAGELLQEHVITVPVAAHDSYMSLHEDIMARAEGKGEAARLPEEFDVGVQSAHVSGF